MIEPGTKARKRAVFETAKALGPQVFLGRLLLALPLALATTAGLLLINPAGLGEMVLARSDGWLAAWLLFMGLTIAWGGLLLGHMLRRLERG